MPYRSGPAATALQAAHPHELGIQEFATYGLVVDGRSQREYDDDHIPGAVCVPLGEAASRLRRSYRRAAPPKNAAPGAAPIPPDVPRRLTEATATVAAGSSILLYGTRGEATLDAAATSLRAHGFVVDVLAGGWPNYRRWVEASLEVLPRLFDFRMLDAPPASGVDRVVEAFHELGEQVIDFGDEETADRWPGVAQPAASRRSTAGLQTWLVNTLRHQETHRIVWVAGARDLLSSRRLPAAMREALARAPVTWIQVPPRVRAHAWLERLSANGAVPQAAIDAMAETVGQVGTEVVARARAQLADGQSELAVTTLVDGLLPTAGNSDPGMPGTWSELRIDRLDAESVKTQAQQWLLLPDDSQSKP